MMNRPPRIGHLLASNFFGGPEKQLLEHALRITDQKIDILIISFNEKNGTNELIERAQQMGIVTRAIRISSPFDPRLITDVLALLRNEEIDLLCVHGYKANVIGRFASWWAGIPLIAISRGWTGEDTKICFYEWLDRIFLKFANHIVAVSAKQKQKIMQLGIPAEKITVIHNSISVNTGIKSTGSIRRELGLGDNVLIVISAGRLSPEKNYSGLIDAAQIVAKHNDNVFFIVFGEGVLRPELKSKITLAGLSERFFLPGFRADLQALLQQIDIFVLPSFTEGLPNVVLEAFAASKPVVATAVGGVPEVVENEVSGFLTDPHQPEFMAKCILRLAEDPKLRQAMGESGLVYVNKNFTFEQQTEQYEKLYLRLVDGK
jgi:glycosyltransferase involved in cell wall biosynthesis